jgi:hypothetical protein
MTLLTCTQREESDRRSLVPLSRLQPVSRGATRLAKADPAMAIAAARAARPAQGPLLGPISRDTTSDTASRLQQARCTAPGVAGLSHRPLPARHL